ncbi:hypothetical protein [Leuconostoc gelidum]|nr:hypothetical protein [Leuconostoc gelidum]
MSIIMPFIYIFIGSTTTIFVMAMMQVAGRADHVTEVQHTSQLN